MGVLGACVRLWAWPPPALCLRLLAGCRYVDERVRESASPSPATHMSGGAVAGVVLGGIAGGALLTVGAMYSRW